MFGLVFWLRGVWVGWGLEVGRGRVVGGGRWRARGGGGRGGCEVEGSWVARIDTDLSNKLLWA